MKKEEQFLTELMYGVNDDIVEILEEVMEHEGKIHTHDEVAVLLLEMLTENGVAISDGHQFEITDAAKESFKKVYTEEFKQERRIQFKLHVCFDMAYDLYAIIPLSILTKIYNKIADEKLSEEEVMREVKKNKSVMENFAIMDNEFIDHELLQDKSTYNHVRNDQRGKGHYVPTKKEVDFFFQTMELDIDKHVEKLIDFLFAKVAGDSEREYIFATIMEVRELIRSGAQMQDVMDSMGEEILDLLDEDDLTVFFDLLNNMWNNTRMISNAGFTPMELSRTRTTPMS